MATESDHKLAKESATLAGQLLLLLRDAAKGTQITPETLGKIADKKSHELLYKIISDVSPNDAILSEEQEDNLERLSSDRVWIIDPLDGTREFEETGRWWPGWHFGEELCSSCRPCENSISSA